ncbi:FGGY family carbohydrate kinase [Mesorhizobium marinum]|uniref:FGGY family carbohydrate kinase n=1 Tax=Mesorhizobium marinum TaxID=3228790 RepID=UPI0034671307
MSGPFFLGLDAGTSQTKAALFDLAGREIAVAEIATSISRPHPGWSEIDPDVALAAATGVLGRVVRERAGSTPGLSPGSASRLRWSGPGSSMPPATRCARRLPGKTAARRT